MCDMHVGQLSFKLKSPSDHLKGFPFWVGSGDETTWYVHMFKGITL